MSSVNWYLCNYWLESWYYSVTLKQLWVWLRSLTPWILGKKNDSIKISEFYIIRVTASSSEDWENSMNLLTYSSEFLLNFPLQITGRNLNFSLCFLVCKSRKSVTLQHHSLCSFHTLATEKLCHKNLWRVMTHLFQISGT